MFPSREVSQVVFVSEATERLPAESVELATKPGAPSHFHSLHSPPVSSSNNLDDGLLRYGKLPSRGTPKIMLPAIKLSCADGTVVQVSWFRMKRPAPQGLVATEPSDSSHAPEPSKPAKSLVNEQRSVVVEVHAHTEGRVIASYIELAAHFPQSFRGHVDTAIFVQGVESLLRAVHTGSALETVKAFVGKLKEYDSVEGLLQNTAPPDPTLVDHERQMHEGRFYEIALMRFPDGSALHLTTPTDRLGGYSTFHYFSPHGTEEFLAYQLPISFRTGEQTLTMLSSLSEGLTNGRELIEKLIDERDNRSTVARWGDLVAELFSSMGLSSLFKTKTPR